MVGKQRRGTRPAEGSEPEQDVSLADAGPVEPAAGHVPLPFTIVAIGASAGGVEALQRLFRVLPADTGCAFVVIMHLDPGRESLLADLLGRCTPMTVTQAVDGVALEPDHVYTIPPACYAGIVDGRLVLEPMLRRPPRPVVIDRFMIALAADQRERSVGIVLTGADSDGTLGIKAIGSEGGMTMAQSPESAAHPDMPLSALGTGMVDYLLPIERIPEALVGYVTHSGRGAAGPEGAPHTADSSALAGVLAQVRLSTGLDFSGYKLPMLSRRLSRRMSLCRAASLDDYLSMLVASPDEARALADDFLIGVTAFFREPEAWRALADVAIPALLQRKEVGEPFRIWVAGCATGEEAFSLGMLLLEQPQFADRQLRLQIFATDVDRRALEIARQGSYPASIAQVLTPERLSRFFVRKGDRYQVCKELREAVVFAPQDIATDPPFSRIDLLSCRNLLIYLEPELQRRVLGLFHFALEPDGVLFLGKSETVGTLTHLFAPVSARFRLYRKLGAARSLPPRLPALAWRPDSGARAAPTTPRRPDLADLVQSQLLAMYAPCAVLIDGDHRALYFQGPVGAFLRQPEGTPTSDLFAMLREGLRAPLRAAMIKAFVDSVRVEASATMAEDTSGGESVRMVVSPVPGTPQGPLLLVTFERSPPPMPRVAGEAVAAPAALEALETELRKTRRELRSVIDELEGANEALRVANEEAMSMNEELQSTNEELETSKEELQSVNEELTTVNQELQEKVLELESANDDLGNLLASTHIPTVFLDRSLRIKRFTPAATRLFRLIPTDLGRPLADITGDLDTAGLLVDARRVLADLMPLERQFRTADQRHVLQRILPYRTGDERIEGVVLTYVDVTDVTLAAERVRQYAAVMRDSNDAIVVHDLDGKVLAWNRGATVMYGYPEDEALALRAEAIMPADARDSYAERVRHTVAGEREVGIEMMRVTRDGRLLHVSSTLSMIVDEAGRPSAIALTDRDITAHKRAEAELRDSETRFRTLADNAPVLIWLADTAGRLEFVNREFEHQTGERPTALLGRHWTDLIHPDDHPVGARGEQQGSRISVTVRMRAARGAYRWMSLSALPRRDTDGRVLGHVGCAVDVDSQKLAEEALRSADRRKDEFLAMLGHELRNPLTPIRNAAEVLRLVGSADPRVAWVHDTLVRQVAHVTRLVDDLLDISRITRGAMNLRLEPVDLAAVIGRAIDGTQALLQARRHRFEARLPPQAVWVEGDPTRLTQVFENLLTNAAKYTDEGGELSISLEVDGQEAVVHVRDSGIGLDPVIRAQVFDLFVQDERSLDRSQGGLGIGLALVRHLVEIHRGRVDAFSEGRGRGSDFAVRLPLIDAGAVPVAFGSPDQALARRVRVLVVDDDRDAAQSMAMVLGLYGYDVDTATDLGTALQAAADRTPQAVLLDLGLPGADGFEVARRLRAVPKLDATRFIALTGFDRVGFLRRDGADVFAEILVKPVDPQVVHRLLQHLLAG